MKNKNHKCNFPAPKAYGNWKCRFCSKIFRTRKELTDHKHSLHSEANAKQHNKGGIAWNKGLTKNTDERVKKSAITYKENLLNGKNKPAFQGRKHSEQSKQQISKSMKLYFQQHPEEAFYKRCHYTNFNYAEEYFIQLLNNFSIKYSRNFHVLSYYLDFAIPDLKIDLEIDGAQHKNDLTIVNHDITRNQKLFDLGWTVIRIYWPTWKKLDDIVKQQTIKKLVSILTGNTSLDTNLYLIQ